MKRAKEDYIIQKLWEKKIPLVAFIELTNRCNLNCIHCMRSAGISSDLSKRLFKKSVSQLAELGTLNLTLTGGEPFLHKDFFELATYAKQKNFNIKISSNGTVIDRRNVILLKSLNPITLQISIYGVAPYTHDAITQTRGSHQKTLRAIRLLQDHGINVYIHMTVMKQNFQELEKIKDKAKKESWGLSYDFVIFPRDDGSTQPLSCRITNEQLRMAYQKRFLSRKFFIENLRKNGKIEMLRDLATISCRISSEGQLFPSGTSRLEMGDLKKTSFHNIWFHSELVNKLRDITEDSFECAACKNFRHCSWDAGLALAEHGSITSTPKEWCRFVNQGE